MTGQQRDGAVELDRITMDPTVMGGKPCIRGLRVTVGMIVGLLAAGHSTERILEAYPYLEREDIRQALACAAWRADETPKPICGVEAVLARDWLMPEEDTAWCDL